jgi:citrate lyase subunit beta/citryl-CoA lyase
VIPLRSWLFVPGNRERFLAKLESIRPDAVILDLEDSIPLAEKAAARQAVRQALLSGRVPHKQLFVRVNPFSSGLTADDIEAVVASQLAGLFLPKVGDPNDVREANHLLAVAETRVGLPMGHTRLIPVVETVRGIVCVAEVAESSSRILALNFGYDDFALDLGVARTAGGFETQYPRARLAIAARAAGVLAIDGPMADFGDPAALEAECRVSRQLGFTGKQCIHPSQIETVNRAFSPSPEELAQARAVIERYEQAAAGGHGSTRLGNQMIDTPVVERARQLLALAAALQEQPAPSPEPA